MKNFLNESKWALLVLFAIVVFGYASMVLLIKLYELGIFTGYLTW